MTGSKIYTNRSTAYLKFIEIFKGLFCFPNFDGFFWWTLPQFQTLNLCPTSEAFASRFDWQPRLQAFWKRDVQKQKQRTDFPASPQMIGIPLGVVEFVCCGSNLASRYPQIDAFKTCVFLLICEQLRGEILDFCSNALLVQMSAYLFFTTRIKRWFQSTTFKSCGVLLFSYLFYSSSYHKHVARLGKEHRQYPLGGNFPPLHLGCLHVFSELQVSFRAFQGHIFFLFSGIAMYGCLELKMVGFSTIS